MDLILSHLDLDVTSDDEKHIHIHVNIADIQLATYVHLFDPRVLWLQDVSLDQGCNAVHHLKLADPSGEPFIHGMSTGSDLRPRSETAGFGNGK